MHVSPSCFCNFDHTSSVSSLLNFLNRPTVEERRQQNHFAVMYRSAHNQVNIHWQAFLTQMSSFPRGHSCQLFDQFLRNMSMLQPFLLTPENVGRSDMKILNKVGDSTPPWGTPALNCFLNEFFILFYELLYWVNALRPLI